MKIELSDVVKNVIDYIIDKEDYKTTPEIDVTQGSQEGDGYSSKTYAISIKGDNGKVLKLFAKYLPDNVLNGWMMDFLKVAFQKEYKFYVEVYPEFDRFQTSKNVKEPFNNVPRHYRVNNVNGGIPPIVLENLRSLGYTLRDRKKPVDDAHLKLPIKAFARYHAISYAMKDQEPERFNKLTTDVDDIFGKLFKKFGIDDMLRKCVDQILKSLDPVHDRDMLEHCKNLDEKLIQFLEDMVDDVDEFSVLGQGDCWSNNMMFLYDEKTGLPIDVKLIDWQAQRISSPVVDLSYFFYTLATKKELDNAEFYLKLYYDTLCQRITELGSDPEKLYPYEIFMKHWRKFAMFGLCMAFCVVKGLLLEKDEIPNLVGSEVNHLESLSKVLKNQDIYNKRMKDTLQYFINHKLL